MRRKRNILIMLAKTHFAMGKTEACLQRLSTLNDTEMQAEDILLKARCEYSLRDFAAAQADYLKIINAGNIICPGDILDLARAALDLGQPALAQELLSRINADAELLKQCKQNKIDKLQSDLRHALVKAAK